MQFSEILIRFLDGGLRERLINRGWATMGAKTSEHERAPGMLSGQTDQSLSTHIVNGLFSLTRLVTYLAREGLYSPTEHEFEQALRWYVLHDLNKDLSVGLPLSLSEFDIPLERYREAAEQLGLASDEADIAAYRTASIHAGSGKVGDRAEAPGGSGHVFRLVRIADSLASMRTPEECGTVRNHLVYLSSKLATTEPRAFYTHRVADCRGMLTGLIHRATADELEEQHGLYPLLFFADSVLYIGKRGVSADAGAIRDRVSTRIFGDVRQEFMLRARDVAAAAYNKPYETFEAYAYLFCSLDDLLGSRVEVALRPPGKTRSVGFLKKAVEERMDKDRGAPGRPARYAQVDDFYQRYQVDSRREENEEFARKWRAAENLLRPIEHLTRVLTSNAGAEVASAADRESAEPRGTGKRVEAVLRLGRVLDVPDDVARLVGARLPELTRGGRNYDHLTVFAYHYLTRARFTERAVSADAVELAVVVDDLAERARQLLRPYASEDILRAQADSELAIGVDLRDYLGERLSFSFARQELADDLDQVLLGARSRDYKPLCTLCNRPIRAEMGAQQIKVQIAETTVTTFSNRLLPKIASPATRRWCPMCYFEFTLRSLAGAGFARGASTGLSDRVYIFLLPDYSFTPELFEFIGRGVLEPFREITRLPLRSIGAGDDQLGVPARWLEAQGPPGEFVEELQEVFVHEAERLAHAPPGFSSNIRDLPGDRVLAISSSNANFQVLIYERSTTDTRNGKDLEPTRTEMWARATYLGALVQLLLGVRVYITAQPYLPLSRPDELKTVVGLDGAAPALRGVLSSLESIKLSDLEQALTGLSAAWVVNEGLTAGMKAGSNREKQVAGVLDQLILEPLAGALFLQQYERAGHPANGIFLKACRELLRLRGGSKMDLANAIATASLELYLPRMNLDGRAYRYELLFRLAVETIRNNPKLDTENLVPIVAGTILKRLEREKAMLKPSFGAERVTATGRLAKLVVNGLYEGYCGRNLAELSRAENAFAAGVYFVTAEQVRDVRNAYFERRKHSVQLDPEVAEDETPEEEL